jgi:hypothetical protein
MTDHSSLPGDQVPRLAAYREAHPDTDITPPGPGQMLWIARRDGAIIAADWWLGKLLDALDWLDADGADPAGR